MEKTISVENRKRLISKTEIAKEKLLESDNYTQEQVDAINDIINLLKEMESDE